MISLLIDVGMMSDLNTVDINFNCTIRAVNTGTGRPTDYGLWGTGYGHGPGTGPSPDDIVARY